MTASPFMRASLPRNLLLLLALLIAHSLTNCGSSSSENGGDPDTDETDGDTSSLIGTWETITENCVCVIMDFIRIRETSGVLVGQHSADQEIYKDAFEIEGDASSFNFSAMTDDFTNDCTGSQSFNCNGSIDGDLMDLNCSSSCSATLSKL